MRLSMICVGRGLVGLFLAVTVAGCSQFTPSRVAEWIEVEAIPIEHDESGSQPSETDPRSGETPAEPDRVDRSFQLAEIDPGALEKLVAQTESAETQSEETGAAETGSDEIESALQPQPPSTFDRDSDLNPLRPMESPRPKRDREQVLRPQDPGGNLHARSAPGSGGLKPVPRSDDPLTPQPKAFPRPDLKWDSPMEDDAAGSGAAKTWHSSTAGDFERPSDSLQANAAKRPSATLPPETRDQFESLLVADRIPPFAGHPPAEERRWVQQASHAVELESVPQTIVAPKVPSESEPSGRLELAVPNVPAAETDSGVLRLRNPALCSRIDGFGQIVEIETPEFTQGQPALLYCELENFRSQYIVEAEEYETRLTAELQVVDRGGVVVAEFPFPEIVDRARRQRRDFYIHLPLWTDSLGPGDYAVQLRVTDRAGQQVGQLDSPVRFRVAKESVATGDEVVRYP